MTLQTVDVSDCAEDNDKLQEIFKDKVRSSIKENAEVHRLAGIMVLCKIGNWEGIHRFEARYSRLSLLSSNTAVGMGQSRSFWETKLYTTIKQIQVLTRG
jgi:hypothetical protein